MDFFESLRCYGELVNDRENELTVEKVVLILQNIMGTQDGIPADKQAEDSEAEDWVDEYF